MSGGGGDETTVDGRAACAGCGAAAARVRYAAATHKVVECRRCGLAWTDPPSSVYQSEYSEAPHLAESYARAEPNARGYARRLLGPLARHARPGGRLLDVGCSIGTLVDEARRAGLDAEGIDLDAGAVAYGRGLGRQLEVAALDDWPGRDYDAITLSHVMEHIPEPKAFARTLAGRLAAGRGVLAVVVPCHRGLHPRLFGDYWYGWVPHQHYFHYSAAALVRLMTDVGLVPVRTWQDSMDYRWRIRAYGRRKVPHGLAEYAVAGVGGLIGMGDQLTVIARRP